MTTSTPGEAPMRLVFTRGAGKCDRMDVLRDGAASAGVDCPKQGIIPHDMVHYAVESTLHRRGFLRRVMQGEAAAFRMGAEVESDGVERLVEVFQADGWDGFDTPAHDMLDLYRVTCDARGCPALAIGTGDIESVRTRILELTAEWQEVPVGGSMTLHL